MLGRHHIVKQGETLRSLAGFYLGDPKLWPEIVQHNNNPAVINATGTRLSNPDLIFVGQSIYIPKTAETFAIDPNGPLMSYIRNSSVQPDNEAIMSYALNQYASSVNTRPTPVSLGRQAQTLAHNDLQSPAFKYEFDKLDPITIFSPAATAVITLKGSITIQSKNNLKFASMKNGKLNAAKKMRAEADAGFAKLFSEAKVAYDPDRVVNGSIECGITFSGLSNSFNLTLSAGISTKTMLPVLKGSLKAPEIKGETSGGLVYVMESFVLEIEITPHSWPNGLPHPVPGTEPVRAPNQGMQEIRGQNLAWDIGAIIVTIVIIAVVIYVAIVVVPAFLTAMAAIFTVEMAAAMLAAMGGTAVLSAT